MISKLLKIIKIHNPSYCSGFNEHIRCLYDFQLLQGTSVLNNKLVPISGESKKKQNEKPKNKFNYCLITPFVLTVISFYLYTCKQKQNNYLTVAYSLDKNNKGYRKQFNFVADIVEQCGSAVVCIESHIYRLGNQVVIPRGSGFILTEDGLILTNAHVVMHKPQSLQIKLKDGRVYNGQIEDIDLEMDLATIRINEKGLPVMKLGSSYDLRAGEWVIAMGSPLALNDSVSAGVVSSPQRKSEDLGIRSNDLYYIQTDAHTTFGNSGGPLVNLDGEVVGVNTVKVVTGISFAIPVEFVKRFLKTNEEQRKKEGDPKLIGNGEKRGYLGIVMLTITSNLFDELNYKQFRLPDFLINKVIICEVAHNSPAFKSGLRPGDIIAEINGEKVEGVKSVYKALKTESLLRLKIFRKDVFLNITITPDQM